jgi:hypothetical protein
MKGMKNKFGLVLSGLVCAAVIFLSCQKKAEESKPERQATAPSTDFTAIFDGKTLAGWKGDPSIWRVENGTIVGELVREKQIHSNTFLIWEGGELGDFELKAEFKITDSGNSGINYRSEMLQEPAFALRGYQADIDGKNTYTGQNYEERKRATLAYRGQKTEIQAQNPPGQIGDYVERNAWRGLVLKEEIGNRDALKALIKHEDWNEIHLVIKGNRLRHYVNGTLMSDVTDLDAVNFVAKGHLGFQVHVGPPMKVQYRNVYLKRQ